MRRFLWVFLHDDSQPDTVFPEDPYRGLITISDNGPFSRLTHRGRHATQNLGHWPDQSSRQPGYVFFYRTLDRTG